MDLPSTVVRKAGKLHLRCLNNPICSYAIADLYAEHLRGADVLHEYQFDRGCQFDRDAFAWAMAVEAKRARRKARRQNPVIRAKVNRGRAQSRRGYRTEKRIEARLERFGFRRMAMSGALGGEHAGDLRRRAPLRAKMPAISVVECKRREGGQSLLRRWLQQGGAHLLIVDPGGGAEPLAVMDLATLEYVLGEAQYDATGADETAPISR